MINEGNWERHYVMLTTFLRGRRMVFFWAVVHCSWSVSAELQAQKRIHIQSSNFTGV